MKKNTTRQNNMVL